MSAILLQYPTFQGFFSNLNGQNKYEIELSGHSHFHYLNFIVQFLGTLDIGFALKVAKNRFSLK